MKKLSEVLAEEMKKTLSKKSVTTMSYDLDTLKDSNINQEIKDALIERGWNFIIPEVTVHSVHGERKELKADTPETTAWKAGVTPLEACNEFQAVLVRYNTNHINDTPKRFGRGCAFCVCNNEYDAIRVE